MIRTECRAAEIWAQTRSRMVSSGVPGPSMRMRHNELPLFLHGMHGEVRVVPGGEAPVHEEGDFKLLRDGAEAAEVHVLHP